MLSTCFCEVRSLRKYPLTADGKSSLPAVTSPSFPWRFTDRVGHLKECNQGQLTFPRRSVRHTAFLLPAGAFGVISPIGFGGSYGIDEILESRRVVDVGGT